MRWLLWRTGGLVLVLVVAEVLVVAVGRHPVQDPLGAYQVIMPGQSVDALAKTFCTLHAAIKAGAEVGYCEFSRHDDFARDIFALESAHVITRLVFVLQPEGKSLGDFVLCWGKPDIFQLNSGGDDAPADHELQWDNSIYISSNTVELSESSSAFQSVDNLTVEGPAPPCRAAE